MGPLALMLFTFINSEIDNSKKDFFNFFLFLVLLLTLFDFFQLSFHHHYNKTSSDFHC